MFIKEAKDCQEFIAGDNSFLREFFHPKKGDFKCRYSLAQAVVRPGQITKPHRLKTCEVYYILEGRAIMYVDNESENVKSGCVIYIPPDSKQYIENIGDSDLRFLCIVDPAWQSEDEEIL